jgi:hypothetical protein
LRADCQAVILIVAIRGVRARSIAKHWNPAPAILHREAPCLKRHIFLKRDFKSVKQVRGAMFRPKLYNSRLSWHTISWHCPFKFAPLLEIVYTFWECLIRVRVYIPILRTVPVFLVPSEPCFQLRTSSSSLSNPKYTVIY